MAGSTRIMNYSGVGTQTNVDAHFFSYLDQSKEYISDTYSKLRKSQQQWHHLCFCFFGSLFGSYILNGWDY